MTANVIRRRGTLMMGLALVVGIYWASPGATKAQCGTPSSGNNAVYASCTGVVLKGSSAFIDATAFIASPTPPVDFCKILNWVLTHSYPSTGAVIDARGLNSNNTSMSCASNPFASTPPATVLLPAGTILTSAQWALPSGTRLVGEGAGTPAAGVTTIKAAAGFPTTGLAIVRFIGITGDAAEDLAIDGSGVTAVNGITNASSQTSSYVRRVSVNNVKGTGISVGSGASGSGPYSDITVANSGAATCVSVQAPTQGIRGINCKGTSGSAAILLDAPNNLLQDIQASGYTDGVKVASRNAAPSNVLVNVSGGTGVTYVVHLTATNPLSDVSLVAIGANGSTNTIRDDVTGNTLSSASGSTVGMYTLGEPVTAGGSTVGYSLFSTSLNVPSWIVETSGSPAGACKVGSLLSNPIGVSGTTWYVCTPTGWSNIQ